MELDLSKIMPNKPTDENELKQVQEKHRQILAENLENEKKRKARNHRLCEHDAIMEEFFPQTAAMDKAQFTEFIRTLAFPTSP